MHMITYSVNRQHCRTSPLELINNRQDRSFWYNCFILLKHIVLLHVLTTFCQNVFINVFIACLECVFMLKYRNYVEKKRFVFWNLLSHVIIFIELARVDCLTLQKCGVISSKEYSKCPCSLVLAVHCGIFQGANIPVHWKDFTIETPWSGPWLLNKGAGWDAPLVSVSHSLCHWVQVCLVNYLHFPVYLIVFSSLFSLRST